MWAIVADPYHLPRWWPRTSRVENVTRPNGPEGAEWTQVYETKAGRGVRADYRCLEATEGERLVFEQSLEGTPFDRILKSAVTELTLRPDQGATEVTLAAHQRLRGLSRLGSPMMRRATGRTLVAALDGLERVAGGSSPGTPDGS